MIITKYNSKAKTKHIIPVDLSKRFLKINEFVFKGT